MNLEMIRKPGVRKYGIREVPAGDEGTTEATPLFQGWPSYLQRAIWMFFQGLQLDPFVEGIHQADDVL